MLEKFIAKRAGEALAGRRDARSIIHNFDMERQILLLFSCETKPTGTHYVPAVSLGKITGSSVLSTTALGLLL